MNFMTDWKAADGNQIVCSCMNVTKQDIENAVKDGAGSMGALIRKTGATGGCGSCASAVAEVFNLYK